MTDLSVHEQMNRLILFVAGSGKVNVGELIERQRPVRLDRLPLPAGARIDPSHALVAGFTRQRLANPPTARHPRESEKSQARK
jgi:hypothetical protein